MEENQVTKVGVREKIAAYFQTASPKTLMEKTGLVEERLFEFANFLESRIVLLYINRPCEIDTSNIIAKTAQLGKIVVLPLFSPGNKPTRLYKVDHPETDLKADETGCLAPDPSRCREVPKDVLDIALIPGLAFDEKGGRVGTGTGGYDHLIPELAQTARKVALTTEAQMVPMIPMENHDKYVDIIITEDRIIYKI